MTIKEAPTPSQVLPYPGESVNGSDPEYAKRLAGSSDMANLPFYNEDISPKLTVKVCSKG